MTTEWIGDYVTLNCAVPELVERLTMAGLEVDQAEPASPSLVGVVSAKIININSHPSADRLQVCEVDAGAHGRHRVVCGAPNARGDLVTCFALPGTEINGGKRVEKSMIRGVESAGMLCSAAELGFGDDASGILELDPATECGLAISSLVSTNDTILEINITPNRGDCQSALGLARELSAILGTPMRGTVVQAVPASSDSIFPIVLSVPQRCSRYVGRVIEHVDASVPTPLWLKERLRRCGVRSINIVVDVTNYTMLALGQPMHAFDRDRIIGSIEVRDGRADERLVLLDGTDITIDGNLVIADQQGPIALAGVMGGRASGVEATTTRVFLESAFFAPVSLAGTARKLNLHTDAAQRFERGVDPHGQARAVEFATALILQICGGQAGPTTDISEAPSLPKRSVIPFRLAYAATVLGMPIDPERARRTFSALGLQLEESHGSAPWEVIAPSYRFDLTREVDLIEEIARIQGYSDLPTTRPLLRTTLSQDAPRSALVDALRGYLVADGYFEAITYSFISRDLAEIFSQPEQVRLELSNPISQEMAVMRGSLWPGLLQAAQYNLNRQADSVRLFEVGMAFERRGHHVSQTVKIAGVAIGDATPKQWAETSREVDFFDLKRVIENMLAAAGIHQVRFSPLTRSGLHPGQTASILIDETAVGVLGLLHPKARNLLEIEGNPFLFEISLEALPRRAQPSFVPLSRFPQMRRDINVVVSEDVLAETVVSTARAAADGLLKDLQLFDVYRGQGIDSDKKSLALGLIFQASSSTLTDDRVEAAVEKILDRLSRELGGMLRV